MRASTWYDVVAENTRLFIWSTFTKYHNTTKLWRSSNHRIPNTVNGESYICYFTTNYVLTFCQFTEIMHTVVCLYRPPVLNTAHNVLIDGATCNRFHILFWNAIIYLSINALRACVYIYIRQLSSFRAPTLWFIDQTVVLSLCQFFTRKREKNTKILEVRHFPMIRKWPPTVTRRAKH